MSILLGNGDGTFATNSTSILSDGLSDLAVGDFNGDGLSDLAAVGADPGTIWLAGIATTATAIGVIVPGSGTHLVLASYEGDSDHLPSTSPTVSVVAGKPTMSLVRGSGQTAVVGTRFADPLEVVVRDAENNPIPGVTVDYSGAGLAFSSPTATTLANGHATIVATPTTTGNLTATATVDGISKPITFSLIGIATKLSTTTALSISPASSVAPGTVVTLSASVLSAGKPASPGQVLFCNAAAAHCTDINLLGQAQLTGNGTAAIKLRLGSGSHSIKAEFQGTHVTMRSVSPAQSLTVTGKSTTTTTSIHVYNQVFTSKVTAQGALPETGMVRFLDATNDQYPFASALLNPADRVPLFRMASSVSTIWFPTDVQVGDFNGDGIPDLVTGSIYGSTLAILLGNGDGTFTTKSTLLDVDSLAAVGDFNGDGILDVATYSHVLLGNGDGTFTAKSTLGVGGPLAVGDFNGDGIPDLAVTNPECDDCGSFVNILLGKGDGTFTAKSTLDVGGVGIAVGDFNGDGITDLAEPYTSDDTTYTMNILLGAISTMSTATVSGVTVPGVGTHHVYAQYPGDTNHAGSRSATWSVVGTKIKTSAELSVSPGTTVAAGTTVQFTATIAPGEYANYTATGTVFFYNGSTVIARGTVTNGQAVYSTNALGPGVYHLTAAYPGDTNFTASTSAEVTLTVN